jgi:hypothetical protein
LRERYNTPGNRFFRAAYRPERIAAASINWKQHFGYRKEAPRNVFTLMTRSAFRAPTSADIQRSIEDWFKNIPLRKRSSFSSRT